jgi:hypothetical protein
VDEFDRAARGEAAKIAPHISPEASSSWTSTPEYEQVRLRRRAAVGCPDLVHLDLTVRTVGIDRAHGRELLRVDFPDDAPAAADLTTHGRRLRPDAFGRERGRADRDRVEPSVDSGRPAG